MTTLTTAEAARLTGVPEAVLRDHCRRGLVGSAAGGFSAPDIRTIALAAGLRAAGLSARGSYRAARDVPAPAAPATMLVGAITLEGGGVATIICDIDNLAKLPGRPLRVAATFVEVEP